MPNAHTHIDGLNIHYFEAGAPSAAPPVLYVHGTGCNGRVFERHVEALAPDFRSVAIDLPGHGRSEGRGFRSAIENAFYVAGLAKSLGWEQWVVAGHSLGGAVALSVATYFPEQLAGLMLIDTGARLRVNPKIIERARMVAAGEIAAGGHDASSYASSTPQSVIDSVAALVADEDAEVTYRDWIADDSFDCMSRVQQIRTPTLAICGEQDEMTPLRNHVFFEKTMPNCRLEVVPDAGHWPFVEQPERFDEIVRGFLSGLESSSLELGR